jgi:hypothetical protein
MELCKGSAPGCPRAYAANAMIRATHTSLWVASGGGNWSSLFATTNAFAGLHTLRGGTALQCIVALELLLGEGTSS